MHTNTTEPPRVAELPHYKGLPIPYVVKVTDGVPDFKTADPAKQEEVVGKELCAICGKDLDYWIYFVGGPKAIQARQFVDSAMHEDCALFSIHACPYLIGNIEYASDERHMKAGNDPDALLPVSPEPLDKVGLYQTRSYSLVHVGGGHVRIKPAPPKQVRWFERTK